ncbi:MAG: glycine oxidase ThiO [Chloroflexota bacterium]
MAHDVAIIGAGVIGLLTARALAARGRRVLLIDRDRSARQASWASAGILLTSTAGDDSAHAQLLDRSQRLYPELVEDLRERGGIDPEMTWEGHLIPAFGDREAGQLKRFADWERAQGLDTQLLDRRALAEVEPCLADGSIVAAVMRPGGQIDNRRLCRSLEMVVERMGVERQSGAEAIGVLSEGDAVRGVRTVAGDFEAPTVVVAAGAWSGRVAGCLPQAPVVPQRGEILAIDQRAIGLRRVVMKSDDPYLVPRVDGRLVVGATRAYVGYDRTVTAGGVAELLHEAQRMLPALSGAPLVESWSGFRPVPTDGMPLLGPGALEGLYFATGHGANGIAPAPASAELVAQLICGESATIDAGPFDPRRFSDGRA